MEEVSVSFGKPLILVSWVWWKNYMCIHVRYVKWLISSNYLTYVPAERIRGTDSGQVTHYFNLHNDKLRNCKVKLRWVVGGWYERIVVTVRPRLRCFILSFNHFWSCLSRPCQYVIHILLKLHKQSTIWASHRHTMTILSLVTIGKVCALFYISTYVIRSQYNI